MKTNVPLISSLRQPFRSLLLLTLFGLITFGFMTKAVGFILVQRETEVLGSYYRSIGILENVKDPQFGVIRDYAGDISAGIELIETSPYFAYGDQREVVSGVMQQTYNADGRFKWSNNTLFMKQFPMEYWPNVHDTDIWFIGELVKREEVKPMRGQPEEVETIGYSLTFNIDTLLAAYPEDARQGSPLVLLFMFEGNEAAIPIIQEMTAGKRYLIRGWEDPWVLESEIWENAYFAKFQIIPLDDGGLWYYPLAKDEQIDFSAPEMASIKNRIDILNENLHTLALIATADMSAMPRMQEAARFYYLTAGRWLNYQDHLAGNKMIVVPEDFARLRRLELGDELQLTFRPLKDTYSGHIRDGIDTILWRSYPTYQDTYEIVGLYNRMSCCAHNAFIPIGSLRPGFVSSSQEQFKWDAGYSFVLDSSRNEAEFVQAYNAPLQELGISLTFLANNGPGYWAAVDPIRRSMSAEILVFSLLMIVALILAVFLYVMQRKRDYAILRALGVPVKQANAQLVLPLLLVGGVGIIVGGLPAWNYALDQAKATLSTLPMPSGASPSADLSLLFLAGLCLAIFLLLGAFSGLGAFSLSMKPVYELLQDQSTRPAGRQKRERTGAFRQPPPSLSSSLAGTVDGAGSTPPATFANQSEIAWRRKYNPSSLGRYVLHHALRSRFKSILTLAIALSFMLAAGWIRQTMERSRLEIDRLYDTTVVEADILVANPSVSPPVGISYHGSGFVYLRTINSVLYSGFVQDSVLEADTFWIRIKKLDTRDELTGKIRVYAYDSPETFYSDLADPDSLIFASGWDMDFFDEQWTLDGIRQKGIPMLFPSSMLEQLSLKVGERVEITDLSPSTYPGVIVGQYSGERTTTINKLDFIRNDQILVPLSALTVMERDATTFTVAHFSLDPKKNRELPQFRSDMEEVIKAPGAGTQDLHFVIWDEQLRFVVAPLEKNLSLLKALYPVVIAVSVLIGAGLCFLLLLQTTKDAAILRVLGTTRSALRLALVSEPFFLSIIGVVIGLAISRFLWMASGLVPVGALLSGAGLYLAGALTGSVAGALAVTNKKPIELLQVEE